MTTGIKTTITDQQIAELKKRIGEVVRTDYEDWQLDDARYTRAIIRTWAVLNADMRPLYMDPDYAGQSPWGSIIAPPAIIVSHEQIDPETDILPGAFSRLNAMQLEFDQPVRMGDIILAESEITAVEEVTRAGVGGRIVSATIETRVTTKENQSIGRVLLDWHMYERGSDAQRALFGDRQDAHMHSQEDIEALGEEYKLEQQRGAAPLYWGDVKEGDELQFVLKGPTTRTRHIPRSESTWYWGHKQANDESKQHPERFFENENGALEPVMAIDWVHHRAQHWGGLPGALESNADRPHFIIQTLANWMGDAGYPLRMNLEFPIANMIGDVTRSYGRVTGKRQEGDTHVVQLEVWQENQLQQLITTGTAEVILPTA